MGKFFMIGIIVVFSWSDIYASVFKGQRAYMQLCKVCHKSGETLLSQHTQEEWDIYFENYAKKLKEIHRNNPNAMKKLMSKKFKKNLKHIKQFFHTYASDSGNVPACN